MPFDEKFTDVYKLGIQEAANEVGIKAERLDEQIFNGNMLDKIYQEIDNADIIIADMSERNPNVFYEVGYADARNKLIILLTNKSDDIPFDLLHRPHIIYNDSISSLKNELVERLEWAKKEVLKRDTQPLIVKIKSKHSWVERNERDDSAIVLIGLELHNISERPINNIHSLFMYSGNNWHVMYDEKNAKTTDSDIKSFEKRHMLKPDFNLIPAKDWLPMDIKMKKIVAADWRDEERKDKYELDGYLRFVVNTDKNSYTTDEKMTMVVEWDELPF